MKTRHKPPTLVSMWMLDVFCCALGCVTLLWLLNTREAGEQAKRAGSALERLAQTEADLARTKTEFDRTRRQLTADIEDLRGKLAVTTEERDDTAKKLAVATTDLSDTKAKLATATTRSKELDDALAKKTTAAEELAAKLSTSTRSAEELARLLRLREKERDDVTVKAKAAAEQLNDLDARLKAATQAAKDANADLAAMRKTGDELASAKAANKTLQSKLDEANANIIDLQGQKAKLADKYDKLRSDAENRFAGIALTGRRVVFVIDTSGSMVMLDPKTSAPDKWPTVIDTIGKVMRSLPGLEKVQVVIFSRDARYLFKDAWIDYRGEATVTRVAEGLRKVTPDGGTNLYAGLDLAFRLRAEGLDTVYLFSDGLPTNGPGLTPDQDAKLANSTERTDLLSKHIRQTLATDWNRRVGGERVKVNAVGFFFESPEVGAFLWALARDNDGSFVGMSRP